MIATAFGIALGAIRRNLVRSMLTALGIVIGVASVIAMVQLGEAASLQVTQEIQAMGPNLLTVRPGVDRGPGGVRGEARPFTLRDAEALSAIPRIRVAPVTESLVTLVVGNANYATTVTGSTEDYFAARGLRVAEGRSFEERELSSGAAVCVIGRTVADELFPGRDPLGQELRVKSAPAQVVGVLAEKGEMMGRDQDDTVIMPLRAVQRRIAGNDDVGSIYVSAAEGQDTTAVKAEIEQLLGQRRVGSTADSQDFNVRDMQELASAMRGTTAALTALLGAIAAVSLLVGGIGIMNIMLVSVTERTREIGIRLAIGARGSEVLLQFLVEAVVLSTLGGLVGIAIGIGGTVAAVSALGMPLVISLPVISLAFGFSAAIGVLFGLLPARKAARLDPIQALRHE